MLTCNDHVLLETVQCNPLDKESIISALTLIQDEDINGNNGEEYLWEVAKENNCKTNLEYLEKLLRESDKDTISGLAFLYFDTWFRNDNYYQTYQFTYNIVGDTAVISVVIISGD